MNLRLICSLPALAAFCFGQMSFAAPSSKELAREAFDRGVAADKNEDFDRAAREFAHADELLPNPIALRAALQAAIFADNAVLGSELVERANRDPSDSELSDVAARAGARFAGRAGKVLLECEESASCLGSLDGLPLARGHAKWTHPGTHSVVVQSHGRSETHLIEVRPGEIFEVKVAPKAAPMAVVEPPPTQGTSAVRRSGLPKTVFWVGAGVTGVLAGSAVALAFVTSKQHSKFVSHGCDAGPPASDCEDVRDAGRSAMHATNGLFAASAVTGVATIVIGLVFTRWSSARSTPSAHPLPGGAAFGWNYRF